MMFKKIFIPGLLLLACSACGPKAGIVGMIENLGDDTLYIEAYTFAEAMEDRVWQQDTITATGGKFSYDPRREEPVFVMIDFKKGEYKRLNGTIYKPQSRGVALLWRPGTRLRVEGEFKAASVDYIITGDEFNHHRSLLRRKVIEYLEFGDFYNEIALDSLMYRGGQRELVDTLFKRRRAANRKIHEMELEYVLANPGEELSGFYMAGLPLEMAATYHERLDPAVRQGLFREAIDYKVKHYHDYMAVQANKTVIQPGNAAPDFTLKSLSGEPLTLSALEGEYVVLDFWGSWCGPCLAGFPKMREYHEKYRHRVTFLGIACKDTEEKWRATVATHQAAWLHVFNDRSSDVPVRYAVEAYPTKLILDKDKRIVARFVGEGNDFYQKLDELLE
jgi:thiol-disulfide isomerase/thioredoxin